MVLPVDNIGLDGVTVISANPSRTWSIDKDAGRIRGECDGYDAIKQAVEIILNTVRYRWQIYMSSSGVDYDNLIGNDSGYIAIELQRRIKDALMMDDRVLGVSGYTYEISGDKLTASIVVNTVYGDIRESMGVTIA